MDSDATTNSAREEKIRDAIFRLLTEEIKDINEVERLSGWTPWVITASLVSISWIIIQDLWAGGYDLHAVHVVFLAVSISINLALMMRGIFRESSAKGKGPFSFLHTNVSPLATFVLAAWAGLVAFAAFGIWQLRGGFVFAVLAGWLGLLSIFSLLATVSILGRFPLPMQTESPGSTALSIAFACLCAYSLVELFDNSAIFEATSEEIRIGGLLALGSYGLVILARSGNRSPLRQTLTDLRRDLILGDISANEALQRARSALQGMWLSDIVREDMQALLKLISEVRFEHEEALRKIATLKQSILASSHAGTHLPDVEKLALASTLDVLKGHEARVDDISKRYYRLLASMRVRLGIAARASRSASSDQDKLITEIQLAQEPVDALLERFKNEYLELQDAWNKWFPEEQRSYKPFGSGPKDSLQPAPHNERSR